MQHRGFLRFNGLVRTTIKTENHHLSRDAPLPIHSGEKAAVSDQVGTNSFYDNATPGRYRKIATELGLELEFERAYWRSAYFQFLFPLHAFWRIYQIAARQLAGENMCESFSMVLTKPAEA